MDVLFVSNGPNIIVAPNVWLVRMLPLLREQGIEPRVLFVMNRDEPCQFVERLQQSGIRCDVLPFTHTEDTVVEILRYLRNDPPDVFVPNLNLPSYFATPWIKAAGIPTLGVLRADDDFHHDLIEEFIFGRGRFALNAVVCKSLYLARIVEKRYPMKLDWMVCASGAPVPKKQAAFSRTPFCVLYSGRFRERQKRISDVVAAMRRIVLEVPDTQCALFGYGVDEGVVLNAAAQPEMQGKLIHGGFCRDDAIQQALLGAQACLLLSDYEGLSTSLMESMASGLVPIVSRMDSGVEDIVVDGENGFIVDDRGDSVVKAVRKLADNEALWSEMSQAARAVVEQRFSTELSAKKWANFLKGLARKSKQRLQVEIPAPDQLKLPPLRQLPNGIAREDRRRFPSA